MPKRAPRPRADAGRRATRSAFQGGLVALLIMTINAFVNPDLTAEQVGVISVVALPIFSYLQNLLEEHGAVPEMLKGKPTDPPATALVQRELESLAAAIGGQHNEIERLQNALIDLRGDRGYLDPGGFRAPEDPARISTVQETSPPRFRG